MFRVASGSIFDTSVRLPEENPQPTEMMSLDNLARCSVNFRSRQAMLTYPDLPVLSTLIILLAFFLASHHSSSDPNFNLTLAPRTIDVKIVRLLVLFRKPQISLHFSISHYRSKHRPQNQCQKSSKNPYSTPIGTTTIDHDSGRFWRAKISRHLDMKDPESGKAQLAQTRESSENHEDLLCRLPNEILLKIIGYLINDCEYEWDDYNYKKELQTITFSLPEKETELTVYQHNPQYPILTNFQTFAVVNYRIYSLCQPTLWEVSETWLI